MGFSRNKAGFILGLARRMAGGELQEEAVAHLDDAELAARLRASRGVGRWTAEYALLRGLGRMDSFPGDDVGAQNHLQRLLHLRSRPDHDRSLQLLRGWRPYRGLLFFHFLLDHLEKQGYVRV